MYVVCLYVYFDTLNFLLWFVGQPASKTHDCADQFLCAASMKLGWLKSVVIVALCECLERSIQGGPGPAATSFACFFVPQSCDWLLSVAQFCCRVSFVDPPFRRGSILRAGANSGRTLSRILCRLTSRFVRRFVQAFGCGPQTTTTVSAAVRETTAVLHQPASVLSFACAGLLVDFLILEDLISTINPDLRAHMNDIGVDANMIVAAPMMSLFVGR